MKKSIHLIAALTLFASSVLLGSCKDKEVATDSEMITPADTAMAVEADTTAAPVNDSNVSGVTSGKMEQVP